MRKTQNGAKRPRDDSHNKPLKFIRGLTLSQHPLEQRKDLFSMKLKDDVIAKSLHPTEFDGYTVKERFAKIGWEQLLNFKCDKIYKRVVIQWTASLSRKGDTLTGIVDEKSYKITPAVIRDLLKVDTRTDLPYARYNINDFQPTTEENKIRWLEASKTVFGTLEDVKSWNGMYGIFKMTPLFKILLRIGTSTFLKGVEKMDYILNRLGAMSKDEYVEVVPPQDRIVSRESVCGLKFSESPTEYIIDDRTKQQRITFPKIVTEGEAPVEPTGIPRAPSNPHVNMTNMENLINKQSYLFLKQHSELITMVTSIQKQMEFQALEAKRREQEIRKHAEEMANNIQKQMEGQALEAERQEQEIEKRAENVNEVNESQFTQMSHTSFRLPHVVSKYYDSTQGDEIPKEFQSLYGDIFGPRRLDSCKSKVFGFPEMNALVLPQGKEQNGVSRWFPSVHTLDP
ncbi:hypothetical protein Tco_0888188 [Tanacetum coccineum]